MAQGLEREKAKVFAMAHSGNLGGMVAFFSGRTEADREKLRPLCRDLAAELRRMEDASETSLQSPQAKRLRNKLHKFGYACSTCIVATAPMSELKRISGWEFGHYDGVLADALMDRNPAWLQVFIEDALEHEGGGRGNWFEVARKYYEAGLVKKPSGDGYILGMIDWVFWNRGQRGKSILEVFKKRPDMLDDVWRLFEVEGGGETSLANSEKYGAKWHEGQSWTKALKQLADDGKLDRARLLDESLRSLGRDFAQYRAGWYSRFHEYMQPTENERAQRVDAYCNLLSSNIPPTVSFALNALKRVQKAGKLAPQPVLSSIGRALLAEQKASVKQALRIIVVFTHSKETRQTALRACIAALEHPAAEVQEAALKLIRKYGVPSGIEIGVLADSVAPSVRKEFADLVGQQRSKAAKSREEYKDVAKKAAEVPFVLAKRAGIPLVLKALAASAPIAALELDPATTPRLCSAGKTVPVSNLDELIECASRVMEEPSVPDEIERMLDGVCRLCDQRPDDFQKRTAQLAKRANVRAVNGWGSWDEKTELKDLAVLLLCWLNRKRMPFERDWYTQRRKGPSFVLRPRLVEFAERLSAGSPFQPLSTPTHDGSWLDPMILADRMKSAAVLTPADAIVALLRLAPENRPSALSLVKAVKGEVATACRYAMGEVLPRTGISDFSLWHAASLSRSFGQGDATLARHLKGPGPFFESAIWHRTVRVDDEGEYTFRYLILKPSWRSKSDKNSRAVTTCQIHHIGDRFNTSWFSSADGGRWIATHFNVCHEQFFAVGASFIGNNLDWSEVEWQDKAYLEPLLNPDCAMGPMATLCLVLGLGAKEPGQHGLATDILIHAVEDGRIAGENLGAAMGSLLFTGLVKLPRWAKTLGQTAKISTLHAQVVRLAIERAVACAGNSDPPIGLNELLELCHQLAIEAGVAFSSDATRQFLEGIKSGGKTMKAARSLLSLRPDPASSHTIEAAELALQGRLARVARWNHE